MGWIQCSDVIDMSLTDVDIYQEMMKGRGTSLHIQRRQNLNLVLLLISPCYTKVVGDFRWFPIRWVLPTPHAVRMQCPCSAIRLPR